MLADAHARALSRAPHGGAFADVRVVAEEDAAHAVLFQRLHHAARAVLKEEDLAVFGARKPVDGGDPVADRTHRARLLGNGAGRPALQRLAQQGNDVAVHVGRLGKEVLQLPQPSFDAPVVDLRADFEAEAVGIERALFKDELRILAVAALQEGFEAGALRRVGRGGAV